MRHVATAAVLAATFAAAPAAQQPETQRPAPGTHQNDFKREGKARQRTQKDALEGKAPPALAVTRWMNIKGKSLSWSELKGKVILLKFWGVW